MDRCVVCGLNHMGLATSSHPFCWCAFTDVSRVCGCDLPAYEPGGWPGYHCHHGDDPARRGQEAGGRGEDREAGRSSFGRLLSTTLHPPSLSTLDPLIGRAGPQTGGPPRGRDRHACMRHAASVPEPGLCPFIRAGPRTASALSAGGRERQT